jgi:hypothetical protein
MVIRKMVRMNFKRAALISTIGTALGTIGSFWTARVSIRSITSIQPSWKWWVTLLIAAVVLLDAMLPLFYFALYRFKGTLKFPKWSRTAALLAACALGVVFCAEALNFAQLRILPATSQYLSLFAELCCAVLLFQVHWAKVAENPTPLPRSGPFFGVTKAAGLWGGLWIAIGCFQVVAMPFVYAVVRHIATGSGRPSPQFAHMLVQNIEKFVNVLCLWITPWLVYTIHRQAKRTESMATEWSEPQK